jgi:tetratricopeptide (TPR) repeat protein
MRGSNCLILLSALVVLVALPVASQSQLSPNPANRTSDPSAPALAAAAPPPISLLAAEQLGDQLMAQRRYHAALEVYSRVSVPSAKLWARMGVAYELLFGLDRAVECYQKALKLEPNNARDLNDLATALDQLGEHDQAERLYRRAIILNPDSAVYSKNLGTNLLAQHEFRKGLEAYRRALALDPHVLDDHNDPAMILPSAENAETNYARARSCAQAGITDCALDYLRKVLREGSVTAKAIASDSDFGALQNDPALRRLLDEQK